MSAATFLANADAACAQNVWRAQDFARQEVVVSTGYPKLDEQLPGNGWPVGHLIEVLQHRPHEHAWQLLLPALANSSGTGPVVFVGPPSVPFLPGIAARGLCAERVLLVQADAPAARLWACEQALRCADVSAVVGWLGRCESSELRRLHIAAQQHEKLLFALRPITAKTSASPARLRMVVESTAGDEIAVRILKRRGPPAMDSLNLPAYPKRLRALLESRKTSGRILVLTTGKRSHVLDRTAAIA